MKKIQVEEKTPNGYQSIVWKVDPEKDFDIQETTLDYHLCNQGKILLKYGDLYAMLKSELARKEEQTKELYSKVAIVVRSEAEKEGVKLTEAKVSEKAITHPEYRKAVDALNDVRYRYHHAEGWWKTANQVASLLQSLAYKQGSEIKKGY